MQLATASVPDPDWHAAYLANLALTGRGNTSYSQAAKGFFRRWPEPQAWAGESLEVRLSAGSATRPIGQPTRPDGRPGGLTSHHRTAAR